MGQFYGDPAPNQAERDDVAGFELRPVQVIGNSPVWNGSNLLSSTGRAVRSPSAGCSLRYEPLGEL